MVLAVARQMIKSIMDPIFIIMILLIIYMYKRIKMTDTNTAVKMGLIDSARGILLGILASTLLIKFDIIIPFSYKLFLLIPMAILLMLIDVKWGCFSYIIPVFYALNSFTVAAGLKITWFELPYKKLIVLVGVLHLMEGILVLLHGHDNAYEVPIYKENHINKGYSSNKFWPIPLLIFKTAGIVPLVPIYAILGYGDVAFYKTPRQKSAYMGALLIIYGSLIFIMGLNVIDGYFPEILGIIMMPVCHELLFILNKHYDMHKISV